MAASFLAPAGPAARAAGGDLAERPVPPGLLVLAGGRPPVRRITRAVLYQLALRGGRLDPGGVSHGPRWSMTSVLYRPMMLSASALS